MVDREATLERQLAEQAATLRESEERWQQIFATDLGCVKVLARDGSLLQMNPAGLKLIEADSFEQIAGHCAYLLAVPEDRPKFQELVERVFEGHTDAIEIRVVGLKGTPRIMECHASPLRDAYGKITTILAVTRDITRRRMMEESLRQSEQRHRLLLENSPIGIFVNENDRFAYVNQAMVRMLGATNPQQLLGTPIFDRVDPKFHPLVRERIRLARELGKSPSPTAEHQYLRLDGTPIDVEVYAATTESSTGTALLVMVSDISERKRTERALRLTQFAVDRAVDAIFWISPCGQITFANDAACKILGYTREELLTLTIPDIDPYFPAENWPAVWENLKKSGSVTVETVHIAKDGRQIHVEVTANYLLFDGKEYDCATMRDITGRKLAEQALKLSEFSVQHASTPTIWVASNARIVRVNIAACQMHGYTEEELLSCSVPDIDPDYSADLWPAHWEELRRSKRMRFETRHKRKDGTIFPCQVDLNWFEFEGVEYNFAFTHDLTEQKQAEEQRHRLEAQLLQSQKLDAVGKLAGGVAHDFNNQLSVILGCAEVLETLLDQPQLRNYVTSIITAGRHASHLTRDLLAFSRKGHFQAEPVDLHKLITDTIHMLEHSIDKRIVITPRLRAAWSTVLGDASQLQNALLNLAVNSRDAMTAGGELTFETSNVELCAPGQGVAHNGQDDHPVPGHYIQIKVSDTGSGLTEETKRHLFEPFFTTKPIGQGTGMGLASVYGTVRNHHGSIDVHSEIGRGTEMVICLPQAQLETRALDGTTITMPGANQASANPLRVLVVDDEKALRSLFRDILKSHGMQCIEADSGRAAVEVYKQRWQQIDVILLDMVTPQMSGPDTFAALKRINPDVKVLLSSGFSINSEIQATLDDGAKGFLQKPFPARELLKHLLEAAR